MAFLVIDIGGANLEVEIVHDGASYRLDRSGTSKSRSYSGKPMITKTYDDKGVWSFTSKWLTTDELSALTAAAQWPDTITIGGEALRITSNDAVPQTVDAKVLIETIDYFGTTDDFLHTARITIEED